MKTSRSAWSAFCAAALAGFSSSLWAGSLIQTVTTVEDGTAGSLRSAITAANANVGGSTTILFDIGDSCGPHAIELQSPLPDLLQETHILGYSQPGASENTDVTSDVFDNAVICIILDGSSFGISDAFTVPATVDGTDSVEIRGIAFSAFSHSAINLRGGSHHVVGGIRTGSAASGYSLLAVGYGVILAAGVYDSTIGGDSPADRNLFGHLLENAVFIASSNASSGPAHDNIVADNLVGFTYDNSVYNPYPVAGSGFVVGGYNNTLESNWVYNSGATGIHLTNLDSYANTIIGNVIESNTGNGVLIDNDSHHNAIQYDSINQNGGAGVRIVNGQQNTVSNTTFEANLGLGIDLADAGETPNDNDSMPPTPDYANRGQNFPEITDAHGGHHEGTVTFTLTSTPGTYTIEVMSTASCTFGSGQGSDDVPYRNGASGVVTLPNIVSNGQATASFTLPFTGLAGAGLKYIVATATDFAGDTSEFSECFLYADDGIFDNDFEDF